MEEMKPKEVVYAAVSKGVVVEYPVTLSTIEQRGHTEKMYYPVKVVPMDIANEAGVVFFSKFTVEGQSVTLSYEKHYKTLEDIFKDFTHSVVGNVVTPHWYIDIPEAEMKYFQKLLGEYYEARLEKVVKERYTSIDTLLGRYRNSSNLVWKKEADFIQGKLDELWTSLIRYFEDLKSGDELLPTKPEDIAGIYPDVSWHDLPQ